MQYNSVHLPRPINMDITHKQFCNLTMQGRTNDSKAEKKSLTQLGAIELNPK